MLEPIKPNSLYGIKKVSIPLFVYSSYTYLTLRVLDQQLDCQPTLQYNFALFKSVLQGNLLVLNCNRQRNPTRCDFFRISRNRNEINELPHGTHLMSYSRRALQLFFIYNPDGKLLIFKFKTVLTLI